MMRRGSVGKQKQFSQSPNVSLIFNGWVGITSLSQAQIILIERQKPGWPSDPDPCAPAPIWTKGN